MDRRWQGLVCAELVFACIYNNNFLLIIIVIIIAGSSRSSIGVDSLFYVCRCYRECTHVVLKF